MRYSNLKAFQKHLESAAPAHLCRVYLLAIPDDYERRTALESLALHLPDPSVEILSAAESDLSALLTAIDSPSLFSAEPATIIDEMEKLPKKFASIFEELIERLSFGYLILGSRTKGFFHQTIEQRGVVLDLTEEKPWDKEKRIAEQLTERARQAGKQLSYDVPPLLFERIDKNVPLLEQEIDKLVCFVGDRHSIERADVFQVSPSIGRTQTLWQTAEEITWEGGYSTEGGEGLIHALRSQFQLGLKIASLLEGGADAREIGGRLPKMWPKTLEKRMGQASRLGTAYFRKGLDLLFQIESASRSGSSDITALLDFFRVSLHAR